MNIINFVERKKVMAKAKKVSEYYEDEYGHKWYYWSFSYDLVVGSGERKDFSITIPARDEKEANEIVGKIWAQTPEKVEVA